MEFATLAAFLIVATVLCLGERGIRVHLARRSGETGPNRQRPDYALATTVKLLARRRREKGVRSLLPERPGPSEKGVRSLLPERPGGCFAQKTPDPFFAIIAALLALATVPFGRDLQLLPSSAGVLVSLAALALAVFAYQLAGETAAEDAHSGALAAARRSVVVLVNVGVLMVGVVMIPGTADLATIVEAQQSLFGWFVWRQPIGLALIFLLILMVHDREPTMAASPAAGNSGTRAGIHWLGAILTRVFLSALVVSLYLGGWSPGLTLPAGSWWALLSVLTFVVKTLLVLYGIIAVGRFLPQFRPDQVQRLGWTMILPCAVANVLLTAVGVTLYQLFISGHAQPGTP